MFSASTGDLGCELDPAASRYCHGHWMPRLLWEKLVEVLCKNLHVWKSSPWNAEHLWANWVYLCGKHLLVGVSIAQLPLSSTMVLTGTLQKLSKSQLLVQSKAWSCHLERGTGKKGDFSGCSFTQRPWIRHSSGRSVPSPGQEQWTAQATPWLERCLHHNQK